MRILKWIVMELDWIFWSCWKPCYEDGLVHRWVPYQTKHKVRCSWCGKVWAEFGWGCDGEVK